VNVVEKPRADVQVRTDLPEEAFVEPEEVVLRIDRLSGRRARAEPVSVLRRPVQPLVAVEDPPVMRGRHVELGVEEQLLLRRGDQASHTRGDAGRLRRAPVEGDVARRADAEPAGRAVADHGRGRDHQLLVVFRSLGLGRLVPELAEDVEDVLDRHRLLWGSCRFRLRRRVGRLALLVLQVRGRILGESSADHGHPPHEESQCARRSAGLHGASLLSIAARLRSVLWEGRSTCRNLGRNPHLGAQPILPASSVPRSLFAGGDRSVRAKSIDRSFVPRSRGAAPRGRATASAWRGTRPGASRFGRRDPAIPRSSGKSRA